ncbi:Arm DNA-binding domain-containing protein [Shewanella indica]
MASTSLYPPLENLFWILRFSINGCRPEMTIGSYPELSLADARDAAFTIFLYVNCKLKRLFE